jgi:ubiquinone/menaquinone biosynthesis C-methylase UbiE/predicted O-methyltransferase YrrM/glycosyltransferase involved in cell wall biosynthesis
MIGRKFGRRDRQRIRLTALQADLAVGRRAFDDGRVLEGIDIFEQLAAGYSMHAVAILAELYDRYQRLPSKDRYHLYQARHFHFGISPGDTVLDIGSGHLPFPLATHLADVTLEDHGRGRAGTPFRHVQGKPVYECDVEKMPFREKEFDFVYCSHVLEHVTDPEKACRELIRVGKRGYVETPTKAKDLFLNSADTSHHTRHFEWKDGRLICGEYAEEEKTGLQCDILMQMHCAPQTLREKAFAALIWLKADLLNTMFVWEGSFEFEFKRPACVKTPLIPASECVQPAPQSGPRVPQGDRSFLQVHTFYPTYLEDFYRRHPELSAARFDDQIGALVRDGFSGIHLFAPYMAEMGYRPHFIVANNTRAQRRWLAEEGVNEREGAHEDMHGIVRRQIDRIRPTVLYLSDPVTFDGRFIRSLSWKPPLIIGWRAADIPSDTDWSGFDLMLSSLERLRQAALELGAASAEPFFPGYPSWVNETLSAAEPAYDVVFSGSWTLDQHVRRNRLLMEVARASRCPGREFSFGLYLNAPPWALPPDIRPFNLGGRFGIEMHNALRSGRIVIDARGRIEHRNSNTGAAADLAGSETANMRIFEATGCGTFLLTEHHENLSAYFTPGVEIETFRDSAELIDKILYYLKHPERRKAIARRGQERCLTMYSMKQRAAELDRIIRRRLEGCRPGPSSAENAPPEDDLARAERLMAQGMIDAGFEELVRAKSRQAPRKNLDLLRARYFLAKGRPLDALEAAREELRWFPENHPARELRDRLEKETSRAQSSDVCDTHLRGVLDVIRNYTMLSEERLASLYRLARRACAEGVPGNFVECGVAAGGSSALLAWVIKHCSRLPRRLYAFDSFSGMPDPTPDDRHRGVPAASTGWGAGTCSAPETSVIEACRKLGSADVLTTVRGTFEKTLPEHRDWVGMIALLHMDGDWFASTRCILDHLYDRLSEGAFVQVDDYGYWDGCRKAVHDFERDRSTRFDLKAIDGTGVWFVKPDRFRRTPGLPEGLIREFHEDDPIRCGIESQMSCNERFQLYYALRALLPAQTGLRRFIEIGSHAGASLHLSCRAMQRSGACYQGIAVEPAGTPGLKAVLRRFESNLILLPAFSHEAAARLAPLFERNRLPEFIFIDGDHSYEGVHRDISAYYPLLAPGGIMMFHDYLPPLDDRNRRFIYAHHGGTEPGIRRACRELLENAYGLQPLELPLLSPDDPSQTQAHLPIIPGVFSTIRAYRKDPT